jgi:hypothetical protein
VQLPTTTSSVAPFDDVALGDGVASSTTTTVHAG